MIGCAIISMRILLLKFEMIEDPWLANASAFEFLLLRSRLIENSTNLEIKFLTFLNYVIIFKSFVIYLSFIWLTTSWELLKTLILKGPRFWINFNLAIKASYSTSLFVVWNWNCKDYSIMVTSGVLIIILASLLWAFTIPLPRKIHVAFVSSSLLAFVKVSLATKLATT